MPFLPRKLALGAVVVLSTLAAVAACTGDDPSFAETGDGAVVADGAPDTAATADGSDAAAPDADAGGRVFTAAAMSDFSACALASDGSTWCWGSNAFGAIGATNYQLMRPTGERLPTPPPPLVSITAGAAHVCGVTGTSEVWCWGLNNHGQLGHDPSTDPMCAGNIRCSPVPKKVPNLVASRVVGLDSTTCALSKSGDVFCWGDGEAGLLGQAATDSGAPAAGTQTFAPVQVLGLPIGKVKGMNAARWPGQSACAVLDDGTTRCWGQNSWAGLGHAPGAAGDRTAADGNARCNPCNPVPTEVSKTLGDGGVAPLGAVVQTLGGWSSCAIVGASRQLYCWGSNFCGQLGSFDPALGNSSAEPRLVISDPVDSFSAGETMCAVLYSKQVRCWGVDATGIVGIVPAADAGASCRTDDGKLVDGTSTPLARANLLVELIDVGHRAVVAIDQKGHVIAWGKNDLGQLGHMVGSMGDDPNAENRNATPLPVEGLDAP